MLQGGRPYIIIDLPSGLVLDLSRADETSVLVYKLHGGDNQQWVPTQEEDGLWMFENVAYGTYLGIEDDPEVGVKVIVADHPTLWEVREEDLGSLSICIPNSPLNVGLPYDGDLPSGTPVELQEDTHRVWRFLAVQPF